MTTHVLIAPRNISGQATMYQRALAPLDHRAEVWSYKKPAFGFGADLVVDEQQMIDDPAYRWTTFSDAVERFDVFHFQFGRSLLPVLDELPLLWDLALLRSLGKRVVMHYRGSDIRRRSTHLEREPHSYFRDGVEGTPEERIDALLTITRLHCDRLLVSTPGLLDDVPDALWIPHAVDVDRWPLTAAAKRTKPVVTHAPSRRSTKGSDVVDAVCQRLAVEGVIEYQPISGVDHGALLEHLRGSDIAVDSLGIGDHGALSVEAMAAGAIAVAHIHPANRERNPGVPVVEADPTSLESVIRDLAQDRDRRDEIRAASLDWVRRRHALDVVGPQLVEAYTGRRRTESSPAVTAGWPTAENDSALAHWKAETNKLDVLLNRQNPVRARTRRLGQRLRSATDRRRIVRAIGRSRAGSWTLDRLRALLR